MEIKKTSAEWLVEQPELLIIDPDGWDRRNYDWSFNVETITKAQFEERMLRSTCMIYTRGDAE